MKNWECSSMVEQFLQLCKALGSLPSTPEQERGETRRREEGGEGAGGRMAGRRTAMTVRFSLFCFSFFFFSVFGLFCKDLKSKGNVQMFERSKGTQEG